MPARSKRVRIVDADIDQHRARAGLGGRIDAHHLAREAALAEAVDLEIALPGRP
jgi:hypothetical protein